VIVGVTDTPAARVFVTVGVFVDVVALDADRVAERAADFVAIFVGEPATVRDIAAEVEKAAVVVRLTTGDVVCTTVELRLETSEGDAIDAEPVADTFDDALTAVVDELSGEAETTVETVGVGRAEAVKLPAIEGELRSVRLGVDIAVAHADDDIASDSDALALLDASTVGEDETNAVVVKLTRVDEVLIAEFDMMVDSVGVARGDTVTAELSVKVTVDETQADDVGDAGTDCVPHDGDTLDVVDRVAVRVTETLEDIDADTRALPDGDVDAVIEIEGIGEAVGETVATLALGVKVAPGVLDDDAVVEPVAVRFTLTETMGEADRVTIGVTLAAGEDVAAALTVESADRVDESVPDTEADTLIVKDPETVPHPVDDALCDGRALLVRLLEALTRTVAETLAVAVPFLAVELVVDETDVDIDGRALCDALGDRDSRADALELSDGADETDATDADADRLANEDDGCGEPEDLTDPD
jgi:hypothetical protein